MYILINIMWILLFDSNLYILYLYIERDNLMLYKIKNDY